MDFNFQTFLTLAVYRLFMLQFPIISNWNETAM